MNTSGLVEQCLQHKEHFALFETTTLIAVSDGRLDLGETEALLGCLHLMQADIGKLIYCLQQAKVILVSKQGQIAKLDSVCESTPIGEANSQEKK